MLSSFNTLIKVLYFIFFKKIGCLNMKKKNKKQNLNPTIQSHVLSFCFFFS